MDHLELRDKLTKEFSDYLLDVLPTMNLNFLNTITVGVGTSEDDGNMYVSFTAEIERTISLGKVGD